MQITKLNTQNEKAKKIVRAHQVQMKHLKEEKERLDVEVKRLQEDLERNDSSRLQKEELLRSEQDDKMKTLLGQIAELEQVGESFNLL